MKGGRSFTMAALAVVALAVALTVIATAGHDSLATDGIIYVDADATSGDDNGTSWQHAFITLQQALDEVALSGTVDEIWVAEGTYTPTEEHGGSGDRYKSFQMANGVAIYGGFDGTEDFLHERDWEAHPTILSGDLDGNDGPNFENNVENSYHVFFHPDGTDLDSTAILDGFTISGGNANGDTLHAWGGGMFNQGGSSPMLTDCTFEGNWAFDGGGMFNNGSSPALINCAFDGNWASEGGGILNSYYSYPTLTNCSFEGNSAGVGGGMSNRDYSDPTLTDCTFEDNSASSGAGMFNYASDPALTSSTFAGNLADHEGGGMYNCWDSSPTLTDCTFASNSAGFSGGGIWNVNSSPKLTNCALADNAANQGGAMYSDHSSPTLINCTFTGNSAAFNGGGMWNWSSSPELTNCTFAGNSSIGDGGGMINYYGSAPILTNCILWGDTPQEIHNTDETSVPVVTYSDIQGGYPGEDNISSFPFFVDAANGDFHLGACSRCIDAGNNDAEDLPPYDFEGDDRVVDGDDDGTPTVDMGVDEVVDGLPCWHVYLPLVLKNY